MAPTGPRGAGPQRSAPRASSRGGISKRRGPARTDRDGDVSMDAPAAGGGNAHGGGVAGRGSRGRGGRDTRGGRSSSRIAKNLQNYVGDSTSVDQGSKSQFQRATLKILGLRNSKAAGNTDGGRRSLLDFLERKPSKDKQVTIGRSVMDGDYVWISVRKDDVPDILRLSGFTLAGGELTITETNEKMPTEEDRISREAAETKQKLTEVLAKRYNPEQRLLDLSALGADPILSQMGTFDSQTLAEKAFKALVHLASGQYKTAAEKKEAIQAVSIAQNDINDVGQVFSLAFALPELKRLDLSGNKLDSISKLAKWQHRFKHLEELHLTGNPVVDQPNYVVELLKWFPSLQSLDGQQVRTPQEAAEALKALEPTPIPQFPSNLRDGDNNVAPAFLQAFFPLFDNDRTRLASEFYDSESWFSLAVIPNSGRNLPWKSYLKFSRNVQKLGSRNPSTLQRLFTGGNLIADLWKALPPTRHPGMDQPGQWLIDCHTFPHLADPTGHEGFAMGLIINVNGTFEEADLSSNLFGTRTFSRTFILGPSKPHNPPPQHPYRVISDQLTLHNWEPSAVPQPTAAVPADPGLVGGPVQPVGAVVLDDATKNRLILELSQRTGMTPQYSELCLSGAANWNFDLALQSFQEQKANLPPDAFISAA